MNSTPPLPDLPKLLFSFFLLLVTYILYNCFFHPLASVPGPFLAKFSELYRFYHNFIRHGSLYTQFDALKAKYGTVVRIAPNEVIVFDPSYYDTLYSAHTKYYKDPSFYPLTGTGSVFTIISNEAHRKQRAVINSFFSRRAALDQEDLVQEKATKLCDRIQRDSERGVMTDIGMGFRALSVDVATAYCYGLNACYNSLDAEDFGKWYNELITQIAPMMYVLKLVPILKRPLQGMPNWLARRINPLVTGLQMLMIEAHRQVERIVKEIEAGVTPERKTIFHTILNPEAGEGDYKAPPMQQIVEEAWGITGAAVETSGNSLGLIAFRVLNDREVHRRLTEELITAFPDPSARMDFLTLEKLPYLTGVVKEGLRLSYGVIYPLPRVVPKEIGDATFGGHHIPAGCVVSMSNYTMHRDREVFPDPDVFDPERWLDPVEARHRDNFLVTFSRGRRACIGQSLAMLELYVATAQLFRRFDDLEAPFVGLEDFRYEDYFLAIHPADARKFKVRRKGGDCR
ncbi:benzoate 4-monooxygenase cytochrome P450 [Immersiella caudata]|uniref:Benzoate 4-monooxygenase cytochrome P450 n=1 Tax=Immersiella caudata TaxID=314043 RepID=A0AA40BZZ9_9PEZI|nr:benzoate 4-monooxygenase cytochrome P450 [Immersiella caudata]